MSLANKAKRASSEFGGDFTAGALSGSQAPGPTSKTMGSQAANAMAIGTGSSGPGDYTSSYQTPNYTQYTSQDFKGTLIFIIIIKATHFYFWIKDLLAEKPCGRGENQNQNKIGKNLSEKK